MIDKCLTNQPVCYIISVQSIRAGKKLPGQTNNYESLNRRYNYGGF